MKTHHYNLPSKRGKNPNKVQKLICSDHYVRCIILFVLTSRTKLLSQMISKFDFGKNWGKNPPRGTKKKSQICSSNTSFSSSWSVEKKYEVEFTLD